MFTIGPINLPPRNINSKPRYTAPCSITYIPGSCLTMNMVKQKKNIRIGASDCAGGSSVAMVQRRRR